MDKQKQELIEISLAVKNAFIKPIKKCLYPEYENCINKDCDRFISGVPCRFLYIAEHLFELGYRKIPENAVVINKDENPCLSCPVPEDIQRDVDCSTICGAVRLGIDWQNQCRVLVK